MTRGIMIDHDAESYPLEIKTDSELGSGDEVRFWFFDDNEEWTGTVRIRFLSTLKYYLHDCRVWANFPITPPNAIDKIWRINVATSPDIRVQIHCNGVEVLNNLLSDSTCKAGWKKEGWAKEKVKIRFSLDVNASDWRLLHPFPR